MLELNFMSCWNHLRIELASRDLRIEEIARKEQNEDLKVELICDLLSR
jgi:hypothetical protein